MVVQSLVRHVGMAVGLTTCSLNARHAARLHLVGAGGSRAPAFSINRFGYLHLGPYGIVSAWDVAAGLHGAGG
jgi:hypothetical protein